MKWNLLWHFWESWDVPGRSFTGKTAQTKTFLLLASLHVQGEVFAWREKTDVLKRLVCAHTGETSRLLVVLHPIVFIIPPSPCLHYFSFLLRKLPSILAPWRLYPLSSTPHYEKLLLIWYLEKSCENDALFWLCDGQEKRNNIMFIFPSGYKAKKNEIKCRWSEYY